VDELKWMDNASCAGTDTEFFFTKGESTQYEYLPTVKRICSNCPVLQECRAYALKYYVLGWWGNTSEKIRREERRRLGITAIPIISDGVYK
jgi:WhiB family redox-sensing transcriptional regulator